ncbi:alpha/beta fold hydrolase [Mycobacterium sp. AMU20-3851]|uniref:alpha/beta hydrolase n=1 Tax=Mycobacterium sp. AMU20-3851 TaxID=3122055 RepID=UPI00375506E6
MTVTVRPRVVMVGAVPMSALVAAVPEPRAVIVAIHGGATTSAYFDCPGRPDLSLLRAGAAAGFTVVALDRPGYGASALYQDTMDEPAARVELAVGAVDKILGAGPRGAGLFVFAHSLGCELALRMTVEMGPSDVLGVELAGTGVRYAPGVKEMLSQASVTARPVGLRELLWEPVELYPSEVLTGALNAPGVAYEGRVSAHWPRRNFPALAEQVRVPVQYSHAEHERVWETSPAALTDLAALFTVSPRVQITERPDSGHNLSVGLSAPAYHAQVLSFIEECIATGSGGVKEAEAG